MLLKVADLTVKLPKMREMYSPSFLEYRIEGERPADIVINEVDMCPDRWGSITGELWYYMESGLLFYKDLLRFDGMMLHASAVEYNGRAYLFSGPCGMGKSTHTAIWQSTFGNTVKLFNDDKPALRRLDGCWYAYGAPWSGKNHININMKVPLAGICFLKQAPENKIRRLDSIEALQKLLPQTTRRLKLESNMDLLLSHLDKLIREIPIFELENRPEPAAAMLSYETMRKAAEEVGL